MWSYRVILCTLILFPACALGADPPADTSRGDRMLDAYFRRQTKETKDDEIALDYAQDEPTAAVESAHADESDPAPSEAAMIPPLVSGAGRAWISAFTGTAKKPAKTSAENTALAKQFRAAGSIA